MSNQPLLAYLVADGARARLLLRHAGGVYETIETFAAPSRPKAPRGDGRTRVFARFGKARSAVESFNGGERRRRDFAKVLAEAVNDAIADGAFDQFVLAAPARMARDIRSRLSWDARRELRSELRKDLTKLPEKALHQRLDGLSLTGR